MEDLILVGGGGHCKSVIDVVKSTKQYRIVGILDRHELIGEQILGYDIIGSDDDIPTLSKTVKNFVITVGQIKCSSIRRKIYKRLLAEKVNQPVIIASTAQVSKYAMIGKGTVIHHNAFVNASCTIGNCCIVNSGAIVEHDSDVGDFCHISTGVIINGTCNVGSDTFIGSGTVLNNNIEIAGSSIIGSASVILSSIRQSDTYYGVIK
jgi:sugar O-acyltransferase (sialic acid O-acetyltransferase NeuD family)